MPTNKTIAIADSTKERLDEVKVHPRETYDDVIRRLIDFYRTTRQRKDAN